MLPILGKENKIRNTDVLAFTNMMFGSGTNGKKESKEKMLTKGY